MHALLWLLVGVAARGAAFQPQLWLPSSSPARAAISMRATTTNADAAKPAAAAAAAAADRSRTRRRRVAPALAQRVVAIGDVHGDLGALRRTLRLAGLVARDAASGEEPRSALGRRP